MKSTDNFYELYEGRVFSRPFIINRNWSEYIYIVQAVRLDEHMFRCKIIDTHETLVQGSEQVVFHLTITYLQDFISADQVAIQCRDMYIKSLPSDCVLVFPN